MQILQNMAVKAKFGGAFAWTVFKLFNFLVRGRGGGAKAPNPCYIVCVSWNIPCYVIRIYRITRVHEQYLLYYVIQTKKSSHSLRICPPSCSPLRTLRHLSFDFESSPDMTFGVSIQRPRKSSVLWKCQMISNFHSAKVCNGQLSFRNSAGQSFLIAYIA